MQSIRQKWSMIICQPLSKRCWPCNLHITYGCRTTHVYTCISYMYVCIRIRQLTWIVCWGVAGMGKVWVELLASCLSFLGSFSVYFSVSPVLAPWCVSHFPSFSIALPVCLSVFLSPSSLSYRELVKRSLKYIHMIFTGKLSPHFDQTLRISLLKLLKLALLGVD